MEEWSDASSFHSASVVEAADESWGRSVTFVKGQSGWRRVVAIPADMKKARSLGLRAWVMPGFRPGSGLPAPDKIGIDPYLMTSAQRSFNSSGVHTLPFCGVAPSVSVMR